MTIFTKFKAHRPKGVPDTPAAPIANASTAHALNVVFSDTEVEAALNALGVKVNAALQVLRDMKLINP